jgi:hypothetical protein
VADLNLLWLIVVPELGDALTASRVACSGTMTILRVIMVAFVARAMRSNFGRRLERHIFGVIAGESG